MTFPVPVSGLPAASTDIVGQVYIKTPGRLHLGFLDMHGGVGRMFGCIGLAIKDRGFILSARQAKNFRVDSDGEDAGANKEIIRKLVFKFCKIMGLEPLIGIQVHQAIPRHHGLGSGTQLALAVGVMLARYFRLVLSARKVAALFNRGQRSGIGIGVFEKGGLVVDGGKAKNGSHPPVVARLRFPESWRVILISDELAPCVFGETELLAFSKLPRFSPTDAGFLCRQTLMKLLPAVCEKNFRSFVEAVSAIQSLLGDYFASVQGSRFTSAAVSSAIARLDEKKIVGYGQSSWGPTAFVFANDETHAKRIYSLLKNVEGVKLSVEHADNSGSYVGIDCVAGVAQKLLTSVN